MSIVSHVTSRRPLPGVSMLALVATVALAGCNKENDANAATTTAAAATVTIGPENVAVARQQQIQSGPTISGSLALEKEARLSAEVPGAIVQTMAEAGQRVTRGQLLARIDDAAIQQAYLSARSTLASAQSAASNAERELRRARTLVEAGAIAERDLENATTASTGAQAQLAAARAQVAAAEQNLGRTRITAPFTGVVAERRVSAGDIVAPGMPLFTVVEPGSKFIYSDVGFIVLDTNSIMWSDNTYGDQAQWLPSALAEVAGKRWIFTAGHHPYRSNGTHGNAGDYDAPELSGVVVPNPLPIQNGDAVKEFFDDHVCGISQVYFAGHDHSRQWIDEPTALCGTQMIISGAGASTTEIRNRGNKAHYEDASKPGFMYVVVEGDKFTGEFYDADGTMDYSRTFMHP